LTVAGKEEDDPETNNSKIKFVYEIKGIPVCTEFYRATVGVSKHKMTMARRVHPTSKQVKLATCL
jgi:hypothetical protein